MTRRTPGVTKAFEYLKGLIADPSWQARGELPGVRTLAKLSGISHFTLWKALRRAVQAGLLSVESGRRPRLRHAPGRSAPAAGPLAMSLRKWEALRVSLESDLLRGVYQPGESLPSLKEMQAKYAVCYSTLRKALNALQREGSWPPALEGRSSRVIGGHVLYLAWGDAYGNLHFDEPFDHEYLKALRSACERLNLGLSVATYRYQGRSLKWAAPPGASLPFSALCERAIGFLVRTACPRDVCADLLPQLKRYAKPVAVLDEIESPSLPEWIRRHPWTKSFRPTITGASGEIMARHLLAMGHRRVAVISPFRDAIWSSNRMAGLVARFKQADPSATVVEYTLATPYQQLHTVRENRAYGLLKRALLDTPNWKEPLPDLRGVLAQLERNMHLAVRRERLLEALTPQLELALKRKDLTAWVAIDDDTALLVMDFLHRRKIKIPRDLSLVGFDDTAEGARRDLTSYNFDFERFNHYVLRYLLDPARVRRAEAQGTQAPEGRIIARGSVRRNPTVLDG